MSKQGNIPGLGFASLGMCRRGLAASYQSLILSMAAWRRLWQALRTKSTRSKIQRPQCSIHRTGPCVLLALVLQTKWQRHLQHPVLYRTKGTNFHPAALQIEELCVSIFASASLVSRPGSAAGRSLDGASGWTIKISTAVVVASIPVTWMSVGRRSQSGVDKMWGRLLQFCHRGPNIPVRLPVGRAARYAWRKCPFCGSSRRGR